MMSLTQYQASVDRTLFKDGNPIPLHFAALGLAGEAGEVLELELGTTLQTPEKVLDEVGDVLWYASACARALGSDIAGVAAAAAVVSRREVSGQDARHLSVLASKFADKVKKRSWHGRAYDTNELMLGLGLVFAACGAVCRRHGHELWEAGAANQAKLLKRYPEGFVEGGGVK